MSLGHGSSLVRNGLVFHMDMDNSGKCYKGPNIENKWTRMASNSYNGNGIVADRSEERIVIPEIGRTKVLTSDFYNDYPDVSSGCCPNLFRFSENNSTHRTPVSPSTQYTYGIVYRVESGYTHGNFMYRYEYDSSFTKTTEGGVHNTTKRKHLGNGWYWAWNTFTTQATTTSIGFAGFFYYRYSDVPDKVQLAKVWLTEGDYTQVHPKFWPDVTTTRGSSESIKDLTNNETIDISNLSFTEDGFEFDGTNDLLDISYGNSIDPTATSITVCAWVKSDTTSGTRMWLDAGGSNGTNQRFYSGLSCAAATNGFGSQSNTWGSGSVPNDTNWHFQTIVMDASNNTAYIYDNGELLFTRSYTSYTFVGDLNFGGRSGYYWLGKISSVQVYEKALSFSEIQENFEASRGRFGI